MIYLDWAATAIPEVAIFSKVSEKEIECFGNPSSIHAAGKDARALIEDSRSRIASILRVMPEEIIFTSGGTESNNMIFYSLLSRMGRSGSLPKLNVITTGIEHPSVFEPASSLERFGIHVAFVLPDSSGIVAPEKIHDKLDEHTTLVSIMMVNNETGSIQRINEIAHVIRGHEGKHGRRIMFHVDAVQALGKIPFFPHELGIDAATLSCHKLGGPKGVGCLYVKREVHPEFLYRGGEQELMNRPGTENPGGAFGFALACESRVEKLDEHIRSARTRIERLIAGMRDIEGALIIPEIRGREPLNEGFSPFICKAAFPPIPGEVLVRVLDEKGIAVSTGAACSGRKQKDRHRVLLNMGIPFDVASSSIRISTGYSTTDQDIDTFLDVLNRELPKIRI